MTRFLVHMCECVIDKYIYVYYASMLKLVHLASKYFRDPE